MNPEFKKKGASVMAWVNNLELRRGRQRKKGQEFKASLGYKAT